MSPSWNFHLNAWVILTVITQLIFYGLSFIEGVTPCLAVTVARVLPPHYWVWTLITFNFYNVHIFHLLLDMVTVYLVDVVMFPSWKLIEVIKCCAISQIFTTFLVVATLFISYACTFNLDLLWVAPICGFTPLFGTVLVAARQLTPDNILATSPLGKFRIKHIAFTMFFCFLFLPILRISDYVHFLLFSYGAFVTWIYLRFFQRHSNGDVGDTTDAFKFSGFFPNHLEPPVSIASNAIYNLLVKIRICPPKAVFETEYGDPAFTVRVVTNVNKSSSGDSNEGTDQPSGSAIKPLLQTVVKSS